MKGRRYTAEQKIRVLREAERTDKPILDVRREQQISEQTFNLWKREFGMMEVDQAKKPKRRRRGASTGDPTEARHCLTSGPGTSFTTTRCAEASFVCST
ncbi:MAG TPA: hypothetical protein DIV79_02445 [Opitutae bacterium]|nr:hypothetical protein [Myxococcales bacterium]HCR28863.1 hypothetical protein [Opitutae bacterium]